MIDDKEVATTAVLAADRRQRLSVIGEPFRPDRRLDAMTFRAAPTS
jgi:hypothetical protein